MALATGRVDACLAKEITDRIGTGDEAIEKLASEVEVTVEELRNVLFDNIDPGVILWQKIAAAIGITNANYVSGVYREATRNRHFGD